MSKRKYRFDVCPECKVREGDSSRKRVYQCSHCERWFCKKHSKPRLTVLSPTQVTVKDSAWKNFVEKERKKEHGHPDLQYTKEKVEEFRAKEEMSRARMDAFLDRSKVPVRTSIPTRWKERKSQDKREEVFPSSKQKGSRKIRR